MPSNTFSFPSQNFPTSDEHKVLTNICALRVMTTVSGWRRFLHLSLAFIFFGLAVLGAILPGFPATPFLLHSSPRLNARLLKSSLCGPILVDWQVHDGVRKDVKVKAVVAVLAAVLLTIFTTGYALLPSLAVVALAIVGVAVVLTLPASSMKK